MGHAGFIASVAISPDNQTVLSAGSDSIIRHWSIKTGKLLKSMMGHTKPIWTVAFSPDGKTALSGGGDEVLRHWRLEDGSQITN